MLTPPSSLRRFTPEWEDLLFGFEAAWNEGPAEDLRRFCPPQATSAFILELLRIDVARRQTAGLPIPISVYLKTFPEIATELPHAAHWHTLLGSPTLPFDAAAPTLDFRVAGEDPDASDLARPITVTAAYGNFRLHAQGGLGEVYVAEDTQLHRPVALKLLQERWYADSPRREFLDSVEGPIASPAAQVGGRDRPYGFPIAADGQPARLAAGVG